MNESAWSIPPLVRTDCDEPVSPVGLGRTAEIRPYADGLVLKLFFADFPREWSEREALVTRLVHDAGLAAPAIHDTVEIEGRFGIVMERVDGVSTLAYLSWRPWAFRRLARLLADLHADMHARSAPGLPSQRKGLVAAVSEAPGLTAELRDRLLTHLASRPDGDRVCHGDFHPENLLITARAPVIIDWMTATSGSPAADVARTTLMLGMGAPLRATPVALRGLIAAGRRAFRASYLRQYLRLAPVGREQIDAWMPIVAAARLADGVEEERDALLRLVRRWRSAPRAGRAGIGG